MSPRNKTSTSENKQDVSTFSVACVHCVVCVCLCLCHYRCHELSPCVLNTEKENNSASTRKTWCSRHYVTTPRLQTAGFALRLGARRPQLLMCSGPPNNKQCCHSSDSADTQARRLFYFQFLLPRYSLTDNEAILQVVQARQAFAYYLGIA